MVRPAARPTRDADLLGFGSDDIDHLTATFRELAAIDLDDGIVFDPDSVRAEPIREDNAYGGLRVRFIGRIGSARCSLQVDVGFGDAVTPEPETASYPALFPDFESPKLKVYPVYTVIAEKYQCMVALGAANSRMKDFHDQALVAHRTTLDGAMLARAIAATFARRQTALPLDPPLALRSEFAGDPAKQRQWSAFIARNRVAHMDFGHTIGRASAHRPSPQAHSVSLRQRTGHCAFLGTAVQILRPASTSASFRPKLPV